MYCAKRKYENVKI